MSTAVTRNLTQEIIDAFEHQPTDGSRELRQQALKALTKLGLPGTKHEEYRFTPVVRYLEKNFKWPSTTSVATLPSIDSFVIPKLDANVLTFVNGQYNAGLSRIISPAHEITITTLQEAIASGNAVVKEHLGNYLSHDWDAFAAMNAAFWQNGLVLHVPEHTSVQKPILILHVNDATVAPVISTTRVLAVLESGSTLSVIEKSDSLGKNPVFHNFSEEWIVKEKAHLEYCKIQNDSGQICQVSNTVIYQADSSLLNTFTLTLDGQVIRNNLRILIDGEHCESHFYGLYMITGNTLADNHTVVDHKKPNSFSNELYKGIMDGNSKGVFNGKIYVRPHAQKTNAFQSNRNIILSDTASVNTKPQLEIWADDVKCSHGCTSGQLDDEALFYLRSRGIKESSAQAMLLYAFANEVLAPIQNESLKSYLDGLLADRLHISH